MINRVNEGGGTGPFIADRQVQATGGSPIPTILSVPEENFYGS